MHQQKMLAHTPAGLAPCVPRPLVRCNAQLEARAAPLNVSASNQIPESKSRRSAMLQGLAALLVATPFAAHADAPAASATVTPATPTAATPASDTTNPAALVTALAAGGVASYFAYTAYQMPGALSTSSLLSPLPPNAACRRSSPAQAPHPAAARRPPSRLQQLHPAPQPRRPPPASPCGS
ncbi:MAG: hypothetical protein WDW36_000385 [Sanguina aurantia]